MAWLYILECSDGTYYVGSTTDIDRRVRQHNLGVGAKYTAGRRPVRLVYKKEFPTLAEAYQRERQVHNWKRPKRQALIQGDLESLPDWTR